MVSELDDGHLVGDKETVGISVSAFTAIIQMKQPTITQNGSEIGVTHRSFVQNFNGIRARDVVSLECLL